MAPDPFGTVIDWREPSPTPTKAATAQDRPAQGEMLAAAPRQQGRRLTDKILVAFHHACDQGDFEVAEELLRILEVILRRKPLPQHAGRRRNMESLVAAHERLWQLRNPDSLP